MSPEWRENSGVGSHSGNVNTEILSATRGQTQSGGPRPKPWGTPVSALGEVVTERREPETMFKEVERGKSFKEKQMPR